MRRAVVASTSCGPYGSKRWVGHSLRYDKQVNGYKAPRYEEVYPSALDKANALRDVGRHVFSHLQAKILLDVPGQGIIDFVVTRYRLLLACGRIEINVVAPAMAKKDTALLFKLTNQFTALHSAISLVL